MEDQKRIEQEFKFWSWFLFGIAEKPGYQGLWNSWLMIHAMLGFILALIIRLRSPDVDLIKAATTVFLPFASILIGLTFAWGGSAQSLLASEEIQELTETGSNGLVEYLYTYQLAILTVLSTLVCWGMAGLGLFGKKNLLIEWFLYSLSSLTIRECWHSVLGAQWLLLTQKNVRKAKRASKIKNKEERDTTLND